MYGDYTGIMLSNDGGKSGSHLAHAPRLVILGFGRGQMTGSTRTILQVLEALQYTGWDILVVTSEESPIGEAAFHFGYDVRHCECTRDRPPDCKTIGQIGNFSAAKFLSLQRRKLADVDHKEGTQEAIWARNLVNFIRAAVASRGRASLLVWDVGFEKTQMRLLRPINRALARRATVVLTQGPSVSHELFGRDEVRLNHIRSVLPVLDSDRLDSLRSIYEHAPRPTRFVILCIGSLHPRKDQIAVVKAVALVSRRVGDITAIFAGDVAKSGYAGRFRRKVKRLGLEKVVEEVGWVEDPSWLYERGTLVVHAGRREGLPHVVREAMVAGVPVVARPSGAIPDVIEHGETGMLVGNRSVSALADAMLSLLTDDAKRESIRRRAHEVGVEFFDPNRWQQEYVAELADGLGWGIDG